MSEAIHTDAEERVEAYLRERLDECAGDVTRLKSKEVPIADIPTTRIGSALARLAERECPDIDVSVFSDTSNEIVWEVSER